MHAFWLELRECLRNGGKAESVLDVLPKIAPRLAPKVKAADERQYEPKDE